MHRFWFFPLLSAIIGALYPVLCDAQGWLAFFYCQSAPVGSSFGEEVASTFSTSALWGALLGVVVGVIIAVNDLMRHARIDPSGSESAGRLILNSFWLGLYSLLPIGSFVLCTTLALRTGLLNSVSYRYWFPGFFFLFFGVVDITAILWALTRTVAVEDVLNPRILSGKLRRSTFVVG